MQVTHRCIAVTSQSATGSNCRRPGTVRVGLGRYVCTSHHQHGWVPADEPEYIDPQIAERARRVLGNA